VENQVEIDTLQLTDAYAPVLDGVSTAVRGYARWLASLAGRTTVVAPHHPGHADRDEVDVIRYRSLPLPRRPPYRLGLPRLDPSLWSSIGRRDIDLVHCHSPFASAAIADRLRERLGVPVVATFHSKYRDDLLGAVPFAPLVDLRIRRIVRFLERCDAVWIPSRSAISTLRSYGYDGPVDVVPNGIDLEVRRPTPELRREGSSRLGVSDDVPLLLYVGQIVREKNLELLIAAMARLVSSGRRAVAALVGEGYARSGLERLADDLDVGGSVRLVGPIHDRRTLAACYARADLFAFPSLYDTAGLVVREAAALHTPTVLLESADAAEGIEHGRTGFLSPPHAEGFAHTIAHALDDRARMRTVGEAAARELCRSWREVAVDVASRYRRLLESSRSPAVERAA
jgi:glycosyltransferase involved in cell wall biosynthesis